MVVIVIIEVMDFRIQSSWLRLVDGRHEILSRFVLDLGPMERPSLRFYVGPVWLSDYVWNTRFRSSPFSKVWSSTPKAICDNRIPVFVEHKECLV